MALARNSAPHRIRPIIEQVRMVESSARFMLCQLSERCTPATTSAPPTPMAAASVTLASPEYIEPITDRIRNITGTKSLIE